MEIYQPWAELMWFPEYWIMDVWEVRSDRRARERSLAEGEGERERERERRVRGST
jgi:hypothetical protein